MAVNPVSALADLTLEDSGRFDTSAEVCLRPYPFPYIAAFSLSNDCDSSTIEAFEDWHGYVNGSGETPYGPGLGLEIGDSFWVWAGKTGGLALYGAYPGEPLVPTAHKARVVDLGRAGWFDSLHSLGNWNQDYKGFRHDLGSREDAERALELLDEEALKPFVYTNHSFSPSNVAGPWGAYQKLDDPTHPFYALDLIQNFGFRFFWPDAAQEFVKFGDHLDYRTQDALQAAIQSKGRWSLLYRTIDLGVIEPLAPPEELDAQKDFLVGQFNRTILRTKAADGTPIAAFRRYRGPGGANQSSFHLQATPQNLDALEVGGGAVIVYQHFGVSDDLEKGPGFRRRSAPPVLSPESAAAWRDIAARSEAGRLFVTTTGRLLDYLAMTERLGFKIRKSDDRWVITLDPHAERLDGLAILIPATAPQVSVVDADGSEIDTRRAADPVRPGRHAVYAPWRRLEWIPMASK